MNALETQPFNATDTLGYLRRLFEPGDWIDLQFIHQTRNWTDEHGGTHACVHDNFMTLEQALKPETRTVEQINAAQDDGWNVYVAMNAFTPNVCRRRVRDVAHIRSVYVEFDENSEEGLARIRKDVADRVVPHPDFVIESSPKKFYVIWRVKDFTVQQQEALNSALQNRYGSDPASVDAARVLRLPGTRNLKPKYNPTPTVRLLFAISETEQRYTPADFHVEFSVEEREKAPAIASEKLAAIIDRVLANLDEAGVAHGNPRLWDGSYKIDLDECLWGKEHTTGMGDSVVFVAPSGKLGHHCLHGHCAHRNWPEFRAELEKRAGHHLTFEVDEYKEGVAARAEEYEKQKEAAEIAAGTLILERSKPKGEVKKPESEPGPEEAIPPFDPSVINGIYADFVDLVIRGTTLAPQFAYAVAKTVVGLRMAGKAKFENLDVEPRYYAALIGETGSGKGEAWRRTKQILTVPGLICGCGFKIVDEADSGAGIKDLFKPIEDSHLPPKPVLCYVDEVESLGNKSVDTRNPGIMSTIIELADSTSISRVLAKSSGGSWSTDQARFATIMCGQEGNVYMKAFAGRTKLGIYDRLYPEFGVPVEKVGDLPPIDANAAMALMLKLEKLDYFGTMAMIAAAKVRLDAFWDSQPKEVRQKARWKKYLYLDAYMSAFGRGLKIVEPQDAEIAIKICSRQLIIRKACFTTEVPDRIGYYLGLIKQITERMEKQLATGIPPESVAKSRRDYETETHAFRDNEEHIFARAWETHSRVWLQPITIRKSNGHEYQKFLPIQEE